MNYYRHVLDVFALQGVILCCTDYAVQSPLLMVMINNADVTVESYALI